MDLLEGLLRLSLCYQFWHSIFRMTNFQRLYVLCWARVCALVYSVHEYDLPSLRFSLWIWVSFATAVPYIKLFLGIKIRNIKFNEISLHFIFHFMKNSRFLHFKKEARTHMMMMYSQTSLTDNYAFWVIFFFNKTKKKQY